MIYKVIKYPDGQVNAKIIIEENDNNILFIKERIKDYNDLFIIAAIKEAYDHVVKTQHLHAKSVLSIPCFFGQRSDRRFEQNESFGLKLITDFINNLNFDKVYIYDPHSPVLPALLNNCVEVPTLPIVQKAVLSMLKTLTTPDYVDVIKDIVLVSPDAGAYKKVFKYGEVLNLPVIAANKFRDLKGNVTLNILGDVKNKHCLIVDDLLDGGYTFHLLGMQLKEQGARTVNLYITHGYFNKGVNFSNFIDKFYTTNSVQEFGNHIPNVEQFNIL